MAAGEVLVAALCVLVFALIRKYAPAVLCGALSGAALAVLNFVIMAFVASRAARKAVQNDVKTGEIAMRVSLFLRMILIFAVLIILVKTGLCDPIAAIVPLVAMQPVILLAEHLIGRAGTSNGI